MTARFIRRGVSQILYSPQIADINAVTRAELTAAENLTQFIAEVSGWALENNAVSTPDLGSTFESSIPGTNQASDSSLTFYEDMDEEVIELLFPALTPGFMLFLRKGDKPASKSLDTFPIRVASKGSEFTLNNEPARFTVSFGITSAPGLDGAVPALAA